jgi:hypothetical protein
MYIFSNGAKGSAKVLTPPSKFFLNLFATRPHLWLTQNTIEKQGLWPRMDFLHKDTFDARLQLYGLYEK